MCVVNTEPPTEDGIQFTFNLNIDERVFASVADTFDTIHTGLVVFHNIRALLIIVYIFPVKL